MGAKTDPAARVPLRDVARRVGKDVTMSYRWADVGLYGHRLSSFTLNGRRYTTEGDLATFFRAVGYVEVSK